MKSQIGHLQINFRPTHLAFYRELFIFLEWTILIDEANMLGVADVHGVSLGFAAATRDITNDDGPGTNHLAIAVSSLDKVDQSVQFLQAHQIPVLFDTPRHRPEFCSDAAMTYYQVMFESPDQILHVLGKYSRSSIPARSPDQTGILSWNKNSPANFAVGFG